MLRSDNRIKKAKCKTVKCKTTPPSWRSRKVRSVLSARGQSRLLLGYSYG